MNFCNEFNLPFYFSLGRISMREVKSIDCSVLIVLQASGSSDHVKFQISVLILFSSKNILTSLKEYIYQ